MRTIVFFSQLVLLFSFTALAQHNVILESNGETTIFSSSNAFEDAYNAATDGDVIYLPGLQYSSPGEIEKQITVYGTGYHPDQTETTGRTRISGFIFREGSSGSHFEGIFVNGNIIFAGDALSDISLKRLHVNGDVQFHRIHSDNCAECANILIRECVMNRFTGRYSNVTNLHLFNNILERIEYIQNSNDGVTNVAWIANNVVARNTYHALGHVRNSLVENNIFVRFGTLGSIFSGNHGNLIRNNVVNLEVSPDENNTWENNFFDVNQEELFIEFSEVYTYESDYTLQNPGSYQGTTDNEVGIYGGLQPFKANTRPSNPQILNKNIAGSTDEDGKLQVEVEVEAQDE